MRRAATLTANIPLHVHLYGPLPPVDPEPQPLRCGERVGEARALAAAGTCDGRAAHSCGAGGKGQVLGMAARRAQPEWRVPCDVCTCTPCVG